jgi:uncharacterized phage protein gp47/JayE
MIQAPTILQIYERLQNNLKTKLNLTDTELKSVLDAFCSVVAGEVKLMYLYLEDIQRNLFADTADLSENGGELQRLGMIYLNRNIRPATDGYYECEVEGVAGSVLRSGLTFKSNENSTSPSKLFTLDQEYTLTGTNDKITIRSVEAGLDSVLSVFDYLVCTEPIIGVNDRQVMVSSIITPPLAQESASDYRRAIIDSIQLEPQGGSKTDYRLWALDAQGVRKVYPYVKENNAGTVQVFVEATSENSTDGHGTPTSQLLEDVEAVLEFDPDVTKPIEERGRKPIQVVLEVLPVEPLPVEIEIIGLQTNNAQITAIIEQNIKNYLNTVRPFVAGGELPRDKNDILTKSKIQGIGIDSLTAGNYFSDLVLKVDSQVVDAYNFAFSYIPYLSGITFS